MSVKVYHCAYGDGQFDGRLGSESILSINVNGHGNGDGTCKRTLNVLNNVSVAGHFKVPNLVLWVREPGSRRSDAFLHWCSFCLSTTWISNVKCMTFITDICHKILQDQRLIVSFFVHHCWSFRNLKQFFDHSHCPKQNAKAKIFFDFRRHSMRTAHRAFQGSLKYSCFHVRFCLAWISLKCWSVPYTKFLLDWNWRMFWNIGKICKIQIFLCLVFCNSYLPKRFRHLNLWTHQTIFCNVNINGLVSKCGFLVSLICALFGKRIPLTTFSFSGATLCSLKQFVSFIVLYFKFNKASLTRTQKDIWLIHLTIRWTSSVVSCVKNVALIFALFGKRISVTFQFSSTFRMKYLYGVHYCH